MISRYLVLCLLHMAVRGLVHGLVRVPALRSRVSRRLCMSAGEALDGNGAHGAFQGRLSLAPMMDYTDRHLRYLLRLMSSQMVLYTEMIAAATLHHNPESRERLLCLSSDMEHPVVLQLGGADPGMMAEACEHARSYRYDEINVNCGCPSDKVAGSGRFGAALMREPELVARLCAAMGDATDVPITVKCRIGVDNDDSYDHLRRFVEVVASNSPVTHFIVHARKALLNGISPEANRKIPPLKYDYVYRLVKDFPELQFTLNGGVLSFEDVEGCLAHGVHGVMVGRAMVARPFYWADTDRRVYRVGGPGLTRREVLERYMEYGEVEEKKVGPRVKRVLAKHVHNLFAGEPRGKRFRVLLDQHLLNPDLGIRQVLSNAVSVFSDEQLDILPGCELVSAPAKVRH